MRKILSAIKHKLLHLHQSSSGLLVSAFIIFNFFYFMPKFLETIWPWVLKHIPQQNFFLIVGTTMHTGIFVSLHVFMYVIYKLKLPIFEREKISGKPWPWESDPETWNKLCIRTLKVLFVCHFMIVPVTLYFDKCEMRKDMESFPDMIEMLTQIVFCMVCEDFSFYWIHRTLHNKRLYPYIHKIHHEHTMTVSIASEHAHPIEFFIGNSIPVNLGPKLLGGRIHAVTYYIWIMIRLAESCDAHCGYEFSWSPFRLLPFSGASVYHTFHHSHNAGNYGTFFTFWDTLCGTNKYDEYMEAKKKKGAAVKKVDQDSKVIKKIYDEKNVQSAK